MDLNKERQLALNLFTGIFRQISWCIITGFSRKILIIAELLYRDIIVIVSHVSWLYRIVYVDHRHPTKVFGLVPYGQRFLKFLWIFWCMHCRWWDLQILCNLTLSNVVFKVFHNLFMHSFTDWRASGHFSFWETLPLEDIPLIANHATDLMSNNLISC